jgi:hypothetical protein
MRAHESSLVRSLVACLILRACVRACVRACQRVSVRELSYMCACVSLNAREMSCEWCEWRGGDLSVVTHGKLHGANEELHEWHRAQILE